MKDPYNNLDNFQREDGNIGEVSTVLNHSGDGKVHPSKNSHFDHSSKLALVSLFCVGRRLPRSFILDSRMRPRLPLTDVR